MGMNRELFVNVVRFRFGSRATAAIIAIPNPFRVLRFVFAPAAFPYREILRMECACVTWTSAPNAIPMYVVRIQQRASDTFHELENTLSLSVQRSPTMRCMSFWMKPQLTVIITSDSDGDGITDPFRSSMENGKRERSLHHTVATVVSHRIAWRWISLGRQILLAYSGDRKLVSIRAPHSVSESEFCCWHIFWFYELRGDCVWHKVGILK